MEFNLAEVNEAIAAAIPDRECIVFRDRRFTYAEVAERSRRLANGLLDRGLGAVRDRATVAGHESPHQAMAIYLYNGNEYLEAMIGAFKARLAPVNVNYRYVAEELAHLLDDAEAAVVVYHRDFADTLRAVLPHLRIQPVLIEVSDGDEVPALDGAEAYESFLAGSSDALPAVARAWSPDDLYALYTGGTTGLPRGVLWRQADLFVSALFGRDDAGQEFDSMDALLAELHPKARRMLPAPPFMHAAAHWVAFWGLHRGDTIVIQDDVRRFDAAAVLDLVAREQVGLVLIVGDAFARPLIEALEATAIDLPSLRIVQSGGAPLSERATARLLELLPHARVINSVGSSEAGGQLAQVHTGGAPRAKGFAADETTRVLSDDRTELLGPGHDGVGWLAKRGRIPLGYLHDEAKTAATFPVVAGERWSVPGDRAVHHPDGLIELLGRESMTINSGGEKIFVEEVEEAMRHHPRVADVVVAGRPSERWGQEVVAVVQLTPGPAEPALLEELVEVAGGHVARYKLPKSIVVVERVQRSPSGKPDYGWARQQVMEAVG